MKDLKFRAWLKNEKIMGEVFDINFEFCEVDFTAESGTINYVKYDDIELLQYTGLKDNNGKEIFEGDIVKVKGTEIEHCVEFYEGGFVLTPVTNAYSHAYLREYYRDCKVIGNIFKNGDLLKWLQAECKE